MAKKSKPKRQGCPNFFIKKAGECIFIPFDRYQNVRKMLSKHIKEMDSVVKKGKKELQKAKQDLEKQAKLWEQKHPLWRKK